MTRGQRQIELQGDEFCLMQRTGEKQYLVVAEPSNLPQYRPKGAIASANPYTEPNNKSAVQDDVCSTQIDDPEFDRMYTSGPEEPQTSIHGKEHGRR